MLEPGGTKDDRKDYWSRIPTGGINEADLALRMAQGAEAATAAAQPTLRRRAGSRLTQE